MEDVLLARFGGFGPSASFRENIHGSKPLQGTRVACRWDATALQVRFECIDVDPWATITQRDGRLWEEEVVEVFLDPVGDGEAYFEFEVNPLNTVLDLVLRRNRSGHKMDFAWDCAGLETGVERTADGWTTEITIPFASVADATPQPGAEWRVNFTRIDRPRDRERELTAWCPTMASTFHVPSRFGILRFA